jgi:hypothetical protein
MARLGSCWPLLAVSPREKGRQPINLSSRIGVVGSAHERTERKRVIGKEVRKTAIPHEVVRASASRSTRPMTSFASAVKTPSPRGTGTAQLNWSNESAMVRGRRRRDGLGATRFPSLLEDGCDADHESRGNTGWSTEYLMGKHVIAEPMYRHDPSVALYVPLRCAIYEADGEARFAIDQPSTTLSSLGRDNITQVGRS